MGLGVGNELEVAGLRIEMGKAVLEGDDEPGVFPGDNGADAAGHIKGAILPGLGVIAEEFPALDIDPPEYFLAGIPDGAFTEFSFCVEDEFCVHGEFIGRPRASRG